MITIRPIQSKDNIRMGSIIKKSLEDTNLAVDGSAYYDPQIMYMSEYYEGRHHEAYWVADVEGVVAGGIGVGHLGDRQDVAELQKLYISAEYRGHGISRKLMDTALDFATQHYDQIYLDTFKELEVAIKLYEKYNFEHLTDPYPESIHNACDVWMALDLNNKQRIK